MLERQRRTNLEIIRQAWLLQLFLFRAVLLVCVDGDLSLLLFGRSSTSFSGHDSIEWMMSSRRWDGGERLRGMMKSCLLDLIDRWPYRVALSKSSRLTSEVLLAASSWDDGASHSLHAIVRGRWRNSFIHTIVSGRWHKVLSSRYRLQTMPKTLLRGQMIVWTRIYKLQQRCNTGGFRSLKLNL